jgi:hypothetical protein
MVGVSEVTDSGGSTIDVSCGGVFGGEIFGGGVDGVNYKLMNLRWRDTCFGRKEELISPIPTKKSYGMTLTRLGCHPHTSPRSSITATVD